MLPDVPNPADEAEAADVLAAEPEFVEPDDPAGPDFKRRTAVHTVTLYGLTVETIGGPLPQ